MVDAQDINGLILAGGAGRRVGGRDKGLIEWQGRPLVAHVVQRLRDQVGRIFISCNRNRSVYRALADGTVGDRRQDFQGPLAGLEAARDAITTPLLLICPCDTPLLPGDLAQRLTDALLAPGETRFDISYAHDGTRKQYLCAVLRSACTASLSAYLDTGQRSVRGWYATLRCREVDFSDRAGCFVNCNRLD